MPAEIGALDDQPWPATYLLVESASTSVPLRVAARRLDRRTVLTFPLLPPPQKN